MQLIRGAALLFGLNLLDALLTLIWVRSGVAGEGNQIMARLLEMGDFTFLAAKVLIGLVTVVVLVKWSQLKLARYGLALALAVYTGLMGVHVFTGLAAMGLISAKTIEGVSNWVGVLLAAVV